MWACACLCVRMGLQGEDGVVGWCCIAKNNRDDEDSRKVKRKKMLLER